MSRIGTIRHPLDEVFIVLEEVCVVRRMPGWQERNKSDLGGCQDGNRASVEIQIVLLCRSVAMSRWLGRIFRWRLVGITKGERFHGEDDERGLYGHTNVLQV